MKTFPLAALIAGLALGPALNAWAVISTGTQSHVVPDTGVVINCTYPSAAPLSKAPVTLLMTEAGKPVTDAKVSFTLVTPKKESRNLPKALDQSTPYAATADLDAPGVYQLVAHIERAGKNWDETFEWPAEAFDIPRISPEELKGKMRHNEAVVVDVRYNPTEYVKGALLIPSSDIDTRIADLPKDKLIATYCTCGSEHSAAAVAQQLILKGYKAAAIYGGLYTMKNDGFVMETATPQATAAPTPIIAPTAVNGSPAN